MQSPLNCVISRNLLNIIKYWPRHFAHHSASLLCALCLVLWVLHFEIAVASSLSAKFAPKPPPHCTRPQATWLAPLTIRDGPLIRRAGVQYQHYAIILFARFRRGRGWFSGIRDSEWAKGGMEASRTTLGNTKLDCQSAEALLLID